MVVWLQCRIRRGRNQRPGNLPVTAALRLLSRRLCEQLDRRWSASTGPMVPGSQRRASYLLSWEGSGPASFQLLRTFCWSQSSHPAATNIGRVIPSDPYILEQAIRLYGICVHYRLTARSSIRLFPAEAHSCFDRRPQDSLCARLFCYVLNSFVMDPGRPSFHNIQYGTLVSTLQQLSGAVVVTVSSESRFLTIAVRIDIAKRRR